jgi:hypothetical protein
MRAKMFQVRTILRPLCAILAYLAVTSALVAASIPANPENYRALVPRLKPGDELRLAPGQYPRLSLMGLNGTPEAWIRIVGPASGAPATIMGANGYNTVEITNSSYVSIENLRIDSRGIPGAFGISARGHEENVTHHIRIEGNTLVGQNGSQQTDGISTKTPTWGWIIRGNQILGAGTGIYLGESDGSQPFVAGVIENNLVRDTIGYDMEIKDQISLPEVPGMPLEPTVTIIRNNVFIKNDQRSPDGDRPNLIVGAFPVTGPGFLNMYQIYGNLFYHNHREALFQGSGRFSLHDNIFVDGPYTYPAVVARNQNFPLKVAEIYNNTVYTFGKGIYFGSRALVDGSVVGNLVFALIPISGMVTNESANLTAPFEDAAVHVRSPSVEWGKMDFSPKPTACQGNAIDLRSFETDIDYARDFNGHWKASTNRGVVCRGAYASDRTKDDWQLTDQSKPVPSTVAEPSVALVWMEPSSVRVGSRTTIEITGANFQTGATVSISGPGVTVDQTTVESPTSIKALVTIQPVATIGDRETNVSNPTSKSNSLRFRIVSRPSTGASKRK